MPLDPKAHYCTECNDTGWVECLCGGDLCVCENYGEDICPVCGGMNAFACDGLDDVDVAAGPNDSRGTA